MKTHLILSSLLFAMAAHADCLPSDVGGYGTKLRVTPLQGGTIYSWHCPAYGGAWTGQWLGVRAEDPPVRWPLNRMGQLQELARAESLHAAMPPPEAWAGKARAVLEQTRPK